MKRINKVHKDPLYYTDFIPPRPSAEECLELIEAVVEGPISETGRNTIKYLHDTVPPSMLSLQMRGSLAQWYVWLPDFNPHGAIAIGQEMHTSLRSIEINKTLYWTPFNDVLVDLNILENQRRAIDESIERILTSTCELIPNGGQYYHEE